MSKPRAQASTLFSLGSRALPTEAILTVVVGLVLLCLCWRRLLLENLVPIDGNMIAVTYPNWTLAHSLWLHPRLPLWNPLRNMGTPYLADPITSALYPPMWIISALPRFIDFLRIWVVFHTMLSSGFMAALAYRWYKDPASAAAAAVLGGFNGFFMARIIFQHHFASQAWLPAILYFQDLGSPVGVGICFALQWLAGYPTFSVLSALAALGLALLGKKRGRRTFVLGGALALGLSAIQWIPFLEFLGQSSRGYLLSADRAGLFSVTVSELLKELFLPWWTAWEAKVVAGDPAIETFYMGVVALMAALWACRSGGNRERWIGLACGFCLLLSLGQNIPGYSHLLLLRAFRFPANWLLLASVGMSLLAAGGLAQLRRPLWRWFCAGLIALDMAIFAQPAKSAWGKPEFLSDPPSLVQSVYSLPPPVRLYHQEHLMQAWSHSRLENAEDYLFMRNLLAPSYGMAFGLEDVSNYQTLRLKRADNYRARLAAAPPNSPLFNWANISVIISLNDSARRVASSQIRVLRNPSAKPRVFFAEQEAGKARLTRYCAGEVQADADARKPATVVFSEMDYPGWQVFIDGQPATHSRFEDAFIAVHVPEGRHVLDFRFSPLSFWIGLWISATSWFCLPFLKEGF